MSTLGDADGHSPAPSPAGAACAAHPEVAAIATCARCGDFVCAPCSGSGGRCVRCPREPALVLPWEASHRHTAYLRTIQLIVTRWGAVFGSFAERTPASGITFAFANGAAMILVVFLASALRHEVSLTALLSLPFLACLCGLAVLAGMAIDTLVAALALFVVRAPVPSARLFATTAYASAYSWLPLLAGAVGIAVPEGSLGIVLLYLVTGLASSARRARAARAALELSTWRAAVLGFVWLMTNAGLVSLVVALFWLWLFDPSSLDAPPA